MKKLFFFLILFILLFAGIYQALLFFFYGNHPYRQWDMQSVDTMKYSRDRAREFLTGKEDPSEIDKQMREIARMGATHVAIGTPYDAEFIPVMRMWVASARKHKLKVWFRGNLSGWEEWFEYKKIDKPTHTKLVKSFIENNPYLFEDGDIFTSCTECENGHKVEYGNVASVDEHRRFLLNEYSVVREAFTSIKKDVKSNYYSMNGDLAWAMMDQPTTAAFDGIVVIDHYVEDPKVLAEDIRKIIDRSGGTVILGEFGAPIPDIHGTMTEEEQAKWLEDALKEIAAIPELEGINYWTFKDSSTALWDDKGKAKTGASILREYFKGNKHIIRYSI